MTVVIVLFLVLVGALGDITGDSLLLALVGATMADQISRVGSRLAEMRGPK